MQIVEVRRNDVAFFFAAPFSGISRDLERVDNAVYFCFGFSSFGLVGLWQMG